MSLNAMKITRSRAAEKQRGSLYFLKILSPVFVDIIRLLCYDIDTV